MEPAIFTLFIIEIVWPMQMALRSKLGKGAAMAVTVLVTVAVALALFSIMVWGGRQIAEWTSQNADRIQDSLVASTAWLEKYDIFVFALLADHLNPAAVVRLVPVVAMRVNTILAFALIVLIYVILGLGETDNMTERIAG